VTVRELIAKLKKMDPDAQVVQSKDSEGNAFYPTYSVEAGQDENEGKVVVWP
jgi:hypothetical protein